MKRNLMFLGIGILLIFLVITFLGVYNHFKYNNLEEDSKKSFSIKESEMIVEDYIKELYPYKFLNGANLIQTGKGVYEGDSNYSFEYKLEIDSQSNQREREIAEIEVFIEKGDIKHTIYSEELVIKKDRTYCTQEHRNADVCMMVYDPVCGSNGKTYSNSCVACGDIEVEYYVPGECL